MTIGVDSDLLSGHLKKLVAQGVRKLLLNLEAVTQLDSLGISAVVAAYVSLTRQGGGLKLVCPRGRVQEVLKVIHVADFIPTFEDESQALASFLPQGYSARAWWAELRIFRGAGKRPWRAQGEEH